jgi:hypothetical protein
MDHLVPFHASARVTWTSELETSRPTAVQAFADVHDTPKSWLARATPLGFAVVSMDHEAPFHASANVTKMAALFVKEPAAVQLPDELQATPERALPCAPAGSGVVSTDHEAPFHASARLF